MVNLVEIIWLKTENENRLISLFRVRIRIRVLVLGLGLGLGLGKFKHYIAKLIVAYSLQFMFYEHIC